MPASITVRRPLEWMDTDAAGIWHYSTAIRFTEHAELLLHDHLGVAEFTFGRTPRAHVEFDFRRPVRFGDTVVTTLTVARLGRTSIAYDVELADDAGGQVFATGRVVTVLADDGVPVEVPEHLRAALTQERTFSPGA